MLINCSHEPHVNESGPTHSIPLVKFNNAPHRGHLNFLLVVEERNVRVIEVKLGADLLALESLILDDGFIKSCWCSFMDVEPLQKRVNCTTIRPSNTIRTVVLNG
jgi:hypothetical protein